MFLGYRLRFLRKCRGLSQTKLGKALGVSKVSISGYENGTRNPSIEILIDMINFFNVSADYILGRDLNIVCEDDEREVSISKDDLNIINNLHNNPEFYNRIATDPVSFLENIVKKQQ